jgi:hypothetical protein
VPSQEIKRKSTCSISFSFAVSFGKSGASAQAKRTVIYCISGFPQKGQDSKEPWSTCFLQLGHAEILTDIASSLFIKFIFVLFAIHLPIAPRGKNIEPIIPIIGAPIRAPNSGKAKVATQPIIISIIAENDIILNDLA